MSTVTSQSRPVDHEPAPAAQSATLLVPAQRGSPPATPTAAHPEIDESAPVSARQVRARRRRRRAVLYRAVGAVLSAAVLLCAIGAAALGAAQALGKIRIATVLTGSMAPQIPGGAIVLDRPTPVAQIRPGDVITFVAPEPYTRVVTHRIVEVDRTSGDTIVITKGDANTANDPWRAKLNGDTVWQVRESVPYLGSLLAEVRSQSMRMIWSVFVPLAMGVSLTISVWRTGPPATRVPSNATDAAAASHT